MSETVSSIIEELGQIDGCLGALLVRGGRCAASSLPSVYSEERRNQVASQLERFTRLADKAGFDSPDLTLKYSGAQLLVRPLKSRAALCLLCTPDAVLPTITLFAGVAIDDLDQLLERADEGVTRSSPPATRNSESAAPSAEAALEFYRVPLVRIREEFTAEVGPMGVILFEGHLDRWVSSGKVDWSRITLLRDALLSELDSDIARAHLGRNEIWFAST